MAAHTSERSVAAVTSNARVEDNMLSHTECYRLLRSLSKTAMSEFSFSVLPSTGTVFGKRLNEETNLRVTLQLVHGQRPLLGLFPSVGFSNLKLEEFLGERLNWIKSSGKNPSLTLSASLGYLMPEPLRLEWHFDPTEDSIREAVTTTVRNVIEYGMPFMTRFPNMPALSEWARTPEIEPYALTSRPGLMRAAIFYLNGDFVTAKESLSRSISEALAGGDNPKDSTFVPYTRLEDLLEHQMLN
jgi:hypothetical protein